MRAEQQAKERYMLWDGSEYNDVKRRFLHSYAKAKVQAFLPLTATGAQLTRNLQYLSRSLKSHPPEAQPGAFSIWLWLHPEVMTKRSTQRNELIEVISHRWLITFGSCKTSKGEPVKCYKGNQTEPISVRWSTAEHHLWQRWRDQA